MVASLSTIDGERLHKLAELVLKNGSHRTLEEGACAMEAVAWLAGEEHSDRPQCACPVISEFVRRFNDGLRTDEERNALIRPLLTELVGSRSTRAIEKQRAYLAADWSVRTMLPILCRALEWEEQAKSLEDLEEIVDRKTSDLAVTAVRDVRKHADAYAAAANAAAAAANAAAANAAANAAAANAAAAAYDAAKRDRLLKCRDEINASAADLIKRMCALKEDA